MPTYQLSDGTPVQVSDNPTPEELAGLQKLEAHIADTKHASVEEGDFMHYLKLLPSSLVRGVVNTAKSTAETMPPLTKASPGLLSPQAAEAMNRTTDASLSPTILSHLEAPRPGNSVDRYVNAGGEGTGGAMLFPGGGPIRAAITGAGGGVGGEGAAQLLGDNPITRILGALVGGGIVNAPRAFVGNTKDLVREAVGNNHPLDLKAAVANMQEAKANGVPLIGSQAMPNSSGLDVIANLLAQAPQGVGVNSVLRQQPIKAHVALENAVNNLPGEARMPQAAADAAQEATTGAIKKAQGARTQEYGDILQDAGKTSIPLGQVSRAHMTLLDIQNKYPNTPLAQLAAKLREKLVISDPLDPSDVRAPKTIDELTGILKGAEAEAGSPAMKDAGIDRFTINSFKGAITDIKDALGKLDPRYTAANAAFKKTTDEVVNPLSKSVTGRIAGKGAEANVEAPTAAKLNKVFNEGRPPLVPSSESEILKLADDMSKTNPQAFVDAVKSHLAARMGKALTYAGDRPSPESAANIEKAFAGTDAQINGLRDMLIGVGKAQGLNARQQQQLAQGFENVIHSISKAANRPSSLTGMNPIEVSNTAGKNPLSAAADLISFWGPHRAGEGIRGFYSGKALEALDRMLSSPEGMEKLRQMALEPVGTPKSDALLQSLLAGKANSAGQ